LLLVLTLDLFLPNVLLLALKPMVLPHVEIDADGTPSPPPGADNQQYRNVHVMNLPSQQVRIAGDRLD
jgi:hypothetical protein